MGFTQGENDKWHWSAGTAVRHLNPFPCLSAVTRIANPASSPCTVVACADSTLNQDQASVKTNALILPPRKKTRISASTSNHAFTLIRMGGGSPQILPRPDWNPCLVCRATPFPAMTVQRHLHLQIHRLNQGKPQRRLLSMLCLARRQRNRKKQSCAATLSGVETSLENRVVNSRDPMDCCGFSAYLITRQYRTTGGCADLHLPHCSRFRMRMCNGHVRTYLYVLTGTY